MDKEKVNMILKQFKNNLNSNLAGDGKYFERQEEYFNQATDAILAALASWVEGKKPPKPEMNWEAGKSIATGSDDYKAGYIQALADWRANLGIGGKR